MMAGENYASSKLMSTDCLDFYINPSFMNQEKVNEDEVYSTLFYTLDVQKIKGTLEKLIINIEIKMFLKKNKVKVTSFTIKNVFYVDNCSGYQLKYNVLSMLFNQTIGNAQGIWIVKIENKNLQQLMPQAYNKFTEDELEFKKTLSEWK